MAKDIKSLLTKKSAVTGEELGRAVIADIAIGWQSAMEGRPIEQLFSDADFQRLFDSLTDTEEGRIYNNYIRLRDWIRSTAPTANSFVQQAQTQIHRLAGMYSTAWSVEETYKILEALPLMVTQSEYEEKKKERVAEFLEGAGFDVFKMIDYATNYYMEQYKRDPKAPNPLKALKKEYEKRPIKSEYIKSHLDYYKHLDWGYYALEDGRRSDSMTLEEWQKALSELKPEVYNKTEEQIQDTWEIRTRERIDAEKKLIISSEDENLTHEAALALIIEEKNQKEKDENDNVSEFIYYDDIPNDWTMWDMLEEGLCTFYTSLIGENEDEYLEQAKDFKKEFADLFTIILKDIEPKAKGISKVPLEEWETTVYDFQDLYDHNFFDFKAWAESNQVVFDNCRGTINGIAIVSPFIGDYSTVIDKETHKVDMSFIYNKIQTDPLLDYAPDSEDSPEAVEEINEIKNLLYEGYKVSFCYDTALELMADYYSLPELRVFREKPERLRERSKALQDCFILLHHHIRQMSYPDEKKKIKKLHVLQEHFCSIGLPELGLDKEAIEEIKAELVGFKAFERANNSFMDLIKDRCKPIEEVIDNAEEGK